MAVFQRSRQTVRIWYGCATLVMIGAMAGLWWTAQSSSIAAVYGAVTCGTIVWGWHVAGYYLGFVTGVEPTQSNAASANSGQVVLHRTVLFHSALEQQSPFGAAIRSWLAYLFPTRFRRAFLASLHHELLIVCFVILMAVITLPQPNRWGLWIFLALWLMHTSAKLNIFFGVRNFRIDFLPEHLHALEQFISKRTSNPFFPLSICVALSIVLVLLYQVIDPTALATQSIGATLVGTMILLGILEHWMLVLPVPVALWGWGVRELPKQTVKG